MRCGARSCGGLVARRCGGALNLQQLSGRRLGPRSLERLQARRRGDRVLLMVILTLIGLLINQQSWAWWQG